MPKFADFAGNKEYECKKCHKNTKFAKFYDDKEGKLLTVDGKEPNGKFGKETNVFSARVNLDKTIHPCYEVKWPNPQFDFMEKESIHNAQVNPNVQTAPSPLTAKELDVDSLILKDEKRKDLASCKIINQRILTAMAELPKIVKEPHVSAYFWYADQLRKMENKK